MKTNKRTVRRLASKAVKRIRQELGPTEDELADLVNDIVLDVDALVSALSGRPWYERPQAAWDIALDLRSLLILRLAKPSDVDTAWVIASEPDDAKRMELAKQVHASTVLMLPVSAEECIARIRQDERRSNNLGYWYNAVSDWWTKYAPAPIDTVIATDSWRREGG